MGHFTAQRRLPLKRQPLNNKILSATRLLLATPAFQEAPVRGCQPEDLGNCISSASSSQSAAGTHAHCG